MPLRGETDLRLSEFKVAFEVLRSIQPSLIRGIEVEMRGLYARPTGLTQGPPPTPTQCPVEATATMYIKAEAGQRFLVDPLAVARHGVASRTNIAHHVFLAYCVFGCFTFAQRWRFSSPAQTEFQPIA